MMKFLKAFLREFAFPLAAAIVVIAFAIQAFRIPSGSMENTLYDGDFLLGLKFIYGIPIPFSDDKIPISKPVPGEIVIFRYPGEPEYPDYNRKRYTHLINALMFGNFFWDNEAPDGSPKLIHYADGPKDFIKRCVAKSGQKIAVKNGRLFLDGVEQSLKGQGKYTEKARGKSPRDYLKEVKVPEPGETINFDSLSTIDLWWIRSLMIQEMPDSLVEFGISLTQNGQELQDYVFEGFKIGGDKSASLNFFRKLARTGFFENPNLPSRSIFGSRLVGYETFYGHQLEDLEAIVAYENARFAQGKSAEELEPLKLAWQVLVNGKAVSRYTVKSEVYFMMGDNRDNSADSRYWGFVSTRNIKAKAFIIYFSLDETSRVELLKPWTWIFLPADIRWGRVAKIIHRI
ncbi:MAG: signal peptidase I [Fibromonadaceae bacterium]|jgi:signal peptidase I|nr:signal peptidase I [Fibromonadaceae bacterium]